MRGSLYILATALLWSTAGVLVKLIPWSAFAIASFRGLFSMLLLMLVRMGQKRCGPRGMLPCLTLANVRIGLCMFMTSTCYTLALKLTTAANAIVLQYIAPVLVLLHTVIVLHRQIQWQTVLLTMTVFAGCVMTFASQLSSQGMLGSAVALMSGVALAGQVIFSHAPDADPSDGMIIGSCISFVLFLPTLLMEPVSSFTLHTVGAGLFLGLCQYGLANVCYARGISRTDSLTASLLLTLEPVLSPVWVFLTTGERPSGLAIAGFICVIGAAGVQAYLTSRSTSSQAHA